MGIDKQQTLTQVAATRDQMRVDRRQLQDIWLGLSKTLALVEQASVVVKESRTLLDRLDDTRASGFAPRETAGGDQGAGAAG